MILVFAVEKAKMNDEWQYTILYGDRDGPEQ